MPKEQLVIFKEDRV